METGQGCEEVQDLVDRALESRRWLDLFKEERSNVAQKLGLSEQMANVKQESMLGDGADEIDGVWVDREVVRVLCKFFFQLNQ